MPASLPPPSSGPVASAPPSSTGGNVSLGLRIARLTAGGTLAAVAASVPAALRIAATPGVALHVLQIGLALATLALAPMVGVIATLRSARSGLRAFGGEGAGARIIGLAVFCALQFAGSVHLGTLLRATTHHRPLAGVTFAVAGLLLFVFSTCIAVRAVDFMQSYPRARGVFIVLAGVILAFTIARLLRSSSVMLLLPLSLRMVIIDSLAFTIVALLASRTIYSLPRALSVIGVFLCGALVVVGGLTLRRHLGIESVVRERAAAYYPLLAHTSPW